MEEDTKAISGEVPVKLLDAKIEVKKEDDEETALEKEFIKVEKESIDVKDNSLTCNTTTVVESLSSSVEVKSTNSTQNSELVEAQEKIKQLKVELGTLAQELQIAESEKARFQAEVSIANEKLQKSDKHCEELEIDLKRLKEEMVEAGMKHQSQIESLQEAFGAQEAKHKELLNVKGAFDGLSMELEGSRKMVEKLELDLLSSTDELRKLEELSNERGLHADSESKKALELEKVLEVAKVNAKEMENQMGLMQQELKDLYNKVTQSQHAEEALIQTKLELQVVQEELGLSKLKVAELEQKVASEEVAIQELTQELNLHKASDELLREDVIALENSLSASKEDLHAKDANLKEIELKLKEEIKRRETIEASVKSQELQVLSLQEELFSASKEKETLEVTVGELNGNLLQVKERCSELENVLNISDQKFSKTDSLLSETLSHNTELQEKLKSVEELQKESVGVAEMLSQKNIELEDSLKASNAASEEVKAQLREIEVKLISLEQQNLDLEQKLNLAELKCIDDDREISELRDKTSELSNLLKASEEEISMSKCHFQAYQDRMSQLESSLEKSSLRKAEHEKELKELAEKCAEHENRSTAAQERSIELEELIQVAHSKAENSGTRVGELELLLETTNYRVQELGEQLNIAEMKHKDVEAELKQKSGQVFELSAELEAFQVKSYSLEIALEAANNKERELIDLLNAITEEKKKIEESSKVSGEKLLESENLIDVLQNELNLAKETLHNVVKDFEASGVREIEILEKLKSAEEQLEHQGTAVEKATARSLELESLHESLAKDSELKLQEAILNFTQRDTEAKELQEKVKSLEEQAASHQGQAAETTEKLSFLTAELEESSHILASLESKIVELKTKLLETESRSELFFSENQLLAETNVRLKEELEAHQHKINELHDMLSSVHAEKDANAEELVIHVNTITELKDQHLKALELQSETELHKKETEAQLNEAFERLTHRDSEAKVLSDKLHELESQVKTYEEQLREAAAAHQHKVNELHDTLSSVHAQKDATAEQLAFHLKTITELRDQHSKVLEQQSETELRKRETETQLNEAFERLAQRDAEAKVLSDKLHELEIQVKTYEEQLCEAADAHQHEINELHDTLSSVHTEKDATAEQLAFHARTITELRDQHSRVLELQSETELHKKEIETQLNEAFERLAQRDAEAKVLNDNLHELEIQAKTYEEQLCEASAATEVRKIELVESLAKLRTLEGIVEEENIKSSQLESANEHLAEVNVKLTQELATYETKMNDLQTALDTIQTDKEKTYGDFHLLRETNKDLVQKLATEGERLQSQISSLVEEKTVLNQMYQEARKEVEAVIVQMEDQLNEHQANECSLNVNIEALAAELKVKSEMQAQVADLEHKLLSSETRFIEEIESIKAASAEKEAELMSKLEEHAGKLKEKDVLYEQLDQVQKELNLAHTTISEQREENSRKDLEREAAIKQSASEVEAKHQHVIILEKQIEELKEKLHQSEAQYMEKYKGGDVETEARAGVTMKSRDIGSDTTSLKRKSKKRSEGPSLSSEATSANPVAATTEPTAAMALKFIVGVAIVSMIVGIILGKRY